jgi:hypothetical protein
MRRAERRLQAHLRTYGDDVGRAYTTWLQGLLNDVKAELCALDVAKGAAVGGTRTPKSKIEQMKKHVQESQERYDKAARTYMAALCGWRFEYN